MTDEVKLLAEARVPTEEGEFNVKLFEDRHGIEHLALVYASCTTDSPALVRIHSECITGDVFGSLRCDCGDQLAEARRMIGAKQSGAIVYLRQEGRGIGLRNKLHAYNLQDAGLDTVDANVALGFEPDPRTYGVAAAILTQLGMSRVRLITNNRHKVRGLRAAGIEVTERVSIVVGQRAENRHYMATKFARLDHVAPATATAHPKNRDSKAALDSSGGNPGRGTDGP